KRSVERMQQEINDQCVGSGFRVLQRFAQSGYSHDLLVAHRLSDAVCISDCAVRFFIQAPIMRPMQAVPPVRDKAMGQNPAMITTMAVIVSAGKWGKNRFQWLWAYGGYRFGEPCEIRDAEHAHVPRAP